LQIPLYSLGIERVLPTATCFFHICEWLWTATRLLPRHGNAQGICKALEEPQASSSSDVEAVRLLGKLSENSREYCCNAWILICPLFFRQAHLGRRLIQLL
jgi:hypothetical protein